ncbi:MAG: class II aldolase [Bacteroidetes bacterium]|nr:class II aldolase [Bacteroidota bacterium]
MTASSRPASLPDQVARTARRMHEQGLSSGTSGNVSARREDRVWITPSGVPYARLAADRIVPLALDGSVLGDASDAPSSEWRLHCGIYRARPDAGAVVHTHSPHATALACLREDLPAFHYMVAVAGGASIRCAPYATYGTPELAAHAVAALDGRTACLLANHGVVTLGATPDAALALAREVETLARQYLLARQVGAPVILDDDEMNRVLERFASYGASAKADPPEDA